MKTKDLTIVSLYSVIIIVSSWITIPFAIPFTLQTFAIFFALETLGGKKGGLSVLIFELIGLIGVPVFSGFTGGFGSFLGPTGGFLMGFLVVSFAYLVSDRFVKRNFIARIVRTAICLLLLYVCGTLHYTYTMHVTIKEAWLVTVLPFILFDLLKIVLAYWVSRKVRKLSYIQ